MRELFEKQQELARASGAEADRLLAEMQPLLLAALCIFRQWARRARATAREQDTLALSWAPKVKAALAVNDAVVLDEYERAYWPLDTRWWHESGNAWTMRGQLKTCLRQMAQPGVPLTVEDVSDLYEREARRKQSWKKR